jgi:hypothetical protein
MRRFTLTALLITMALPAAHAASLKENELGAMLNRVAKESSVGTPRAINENLLDRGYTVDGTQLVNHISVLPAHAEQMRANKGSMREQLASSVCNNAGFRQLLNRGAGLRYEFSEYKTNSAIATERFTKSDCGA